MAAAVHVQPGRSYNIPRIRAPGSEGFGCVLVSRGASSARLRRCSAGGNSVVYLPIPSSALKESGPKCCASVL